MNNEIGQNTNKGNGLIAILSIVIVLLIGGCIYLYLNNNKDTKTDNSNVKSENCPKTQECEECKTCEICKECPAAENKWTTYVSDLKKSEYSQIVPSTLLSGEKFSIRRVITEIVVGTPDIVFDETTANGKALISKYGQNYRPLKNIVASYFIENNTIGYYSYIFVKEDGTVYALNSNKLNSSSPTLVLDKLNYKNIVSVYEAMQSGAKITVGVDIDGNTKEIELPLN